MQERKKRGETDELAFLADVYAYQVRSFHYFPNNKQFSSYWNERIERKKKKKRHYYAGKKKLHLHIGSAVAILDTVVDQKRRMLPV